MEEINYEKELATAREIALSGEANKFESDLLGPYTRHLLAEISYYRPGINFQDLTESDLPRWWSDSDVKLLTQALSSLDLSSICKNYLHFDDRISWVQLKQNFEGELRDIKDTKNFPSSGDVGNFGFHLLKEFAHLKRSNRFELCKRENLPEWWTEQEKDLFCSLICIKR